MQLCLIAKKRESEKKVRTVLKSGGDITLKHFSRIFDIDIDGWLDICPVKTCQKGLRIICEENVYQLWCPHCSWLIEDGVEFRPRFMSVPELAHAQGQFSDGMIRRLIENEIIPAANFARSDKSKYMIPIHIANQIIEEGISWALI